MTLGQRSLPGGRVLETWISGWNFFGSASAGTLWFSWPRPGYATSSRQAGRSVVDVVDDTATVLASLGVTACLVAGWSGGGPHALACAARLPEARAALVIAGVGPSGAQDLDFLSGMGQDNIDEFGAAFDGEATLRPYLDAQRPALLATDADGVIASIGSVLPDVDRAQLTDEFGADMAESFGDALQVSVDGWLDDDLAFVSDWGFSLDEITKPVIAWQGDQDLMVPFAHGQWLASHVPGVTAHLMPGEGHLSITVGAIDRMLEELVAAR